MNQTFSFTRFARLHRWLWATKGRTYLIGVGALLTVCVLYLSRLMATDKIFFNAFDNQTNFAVFLFLAIVLVAGMGSDVFSALFRQESAIAYLMIPASRTEKFWLGVLYCLLALAVFIGIYFGYEAVAFSVANTHLKPGQTHYTSSLVFFGPGKHSDGSALFFSLYAFLLCLALCLLGSFYFRRGVLVRNVGVGIVAFVGFFVLYQFITGLVFRGLEVHVSFPFGRLTVVDKANYQQVFLPGWVSWLVYGAIVLMLWITTRVRFNEIER
ncbi:hypothetical protein FAES_3591 [Fibrella aestuarina BUZ 2]|uniref:Uncharacterized protein n=1 Tax=Fibrella aestuarina BUZ 2 TaxID=1166018 RepID=I0KBU5_9BACT|nr:hypothetical protein [Fibrella aestuarina]CCH01598.1 hypothetical protein FAES_3591 [Fibrella aestuarina BUZ 2]